jgi:signal transduction histidine kinase
MSQNHHPFIIDDLLQELHLTVKANLQTAGKPEIDVEMYRYSEEHTCSILADRELLQQVFVHLLDNAVKFTNRGFIVFGYHVLSDNLVDFFVDYTRLKKINDAALDLYTVRDLLQQMGSRLNEQNERTGTSFSFSIKSEQVKVAKIA